MNKSISSVQTFSTDNETSDSIYARNWALPDTCTENKCEWRTNGTDYFYQCCCNTNLCNGDNRQITTTPSKGHIQFISSNHFFLIVSFSYILNRIFFKINK